MLCTVSEVARWVGVYQNCPWTHIILQESDFRTDWQTDGRKDRQTPDEVIPMRRHATQKRMSFFKILKNVFKEQKLIHIWNTLKVPKLFFESMTDVSDDEAPFCFANRISMFRKKARLLSWSYVPEWRRQGRTNDVILLRRNGVSLRVDVLHFGRLRIFKFPSRVLCYIFYCSTFSLCFARSTKPWSIMTS